jgi:hypothetical protein
LSEAWQVLLDNTPPAVELADEGTGSAADEMVHAAEPRDEASRPVASERIFGDRRCRWHGSMGIWRIYRTPTGEPRFDLATRGAGGVRELTGLTRNQLNESWLQLITIRRPATGIEVLADAVGDDGVRRITFRDLRTGDVSAPWQVDELKEGSVREYAARMSQLDLSLDDGAVRWWGNIGYLRPMRSQVDLVYRDANGVDHIYYAARRDELGEHWATLLGQWDDASQTHAPARAGGGHVGGERREAPLVPRGRPANGRGAPEIESWVSGDQGDIVRSSLDGYAPANTPSHQPDPDA